MRSCTESMAQLPGTVHKVWDDQVDVDEVLRYLGRYGKYQILLYVQTLFGIVPAAINIFANVFTGFEPEHQCQPLDNQRFTVESYEKCAVKIRENNSFQSLECSGKYAYKAGKYISFVSEWDLVCDKEELRNLVTTVFHVGMMIGAALFPSLADRYGRKPVYVGSRIGTFIVSLIAILSPNYGFFLASRFFCGLLQPGMNVPGTILIAELFPTENRTHVLLLGGVMWVFGVIVMAPISYIFRGFNWRVLQGVFSMFFICSFIEIWTLDESIRWLIAKNRWTEAKRLIKKAADKNDVDYNHVAYLFRHFDPEEREESQETSGHADKKTPETEIGSDDCSVSAQMLENRAAGKVERNELNGAEEESSGDIEVVVNAKLENNCGSFSELSDFERDGVVEEKREEFNYEQTQIYIQGHAFIVHGEDKDRSNEKKIQNGCVVGVRCPDEKTRDDAQEADENEQMDVSPVIGEGGVVELASLGSVLLRNGTKMGYDQRAQNFTVMQCKLPGMLYIIKEPVLRRMVFICVYLWFVNTLVYYALYLTSTSLAGNRFLNFFLNALAEFPSQVLALKLLISIGRKKTCIIFQSIAGGSLIIAVILRMSFSNDTYIVMAATFFSLIGMFGISGSFLVIWLYTPELFPTGLRNAGMGLASTASRIGSMFSPFSSTLARHISWGPSVIFASFCLVANLLVLTLPETGHRQLPQTVGDIRRWSDEEYDTWNSQYSQIMMRSFGIGYQHTQSTHIENETRNVIHLRQPRNVQDPST